MPVHTCSTCGPFTRMSASFRGEPCSDVRLIADALAEHLGGKIAPYKAGDSEGPATLVAVNFDTLGVQKITNKDLEDSFDILHALVSSYQTALNLVAPESCDPTIHRRPSDGSANRWIDTRPLLSMSA